MNNIAQEFSAIEINELLPLAKRLKAAGARYVQTCGITRDDHISVMYSFIEDGTLCNYVIEVHEGEVVPSITDFFTAAFVFENETHDLFGVNIKGICIDFEGNFYLTSEKTPMTVISPEVKAAREKAAKVAAAAAAAKAAKAKKAAEEAAAAGDQAAEEAAAAEAAPVTGDQAAPVAAASKANAASEVSSPETSAEAASQEPASEKEGE